jgi:thiamine-phosphate pyrophosphorylase
MHHAQRLACLLDSDLYVVITEAFCEGRSALDVLEGALAAGVRMIQFREKGLESADLYRRAKAFRERTEAAGALLIIDDRVDIALAAGADGVHLGLSDLPIDAARRMAPELIIGASSHNLEEALAAQRMGASYVNIGPIFATQTKAVSTGPLGPEKISQIAPHLSVPFTTMGGINRENIERVLEQGARHVAVVTAVTGAPDVTSAAAALREVILRSG